MSTITPLERVYRYYLLKLAGVADNERSVGVHPENAARDVPAWLHRHIEVGLALDRLQTVERYAVDRRMTAAVELDEGQRALIMAMQREAAARRAGNREEEATWARRIKMVRRQIEVWESEFSICDRSEAYRKGINEVLDHLKSRKKAPGSRETVRGPEASDRTRRDGRTQGSPGSVGESGASGG